MVVKGACSEVLKLDATPDDDAAGNPIGSLFKLLVGKLAGGGAFIFVLAIPKPRFDTGENGSLAGLAKLVPVFQKYISFRLFIKEREW